MTTENNLYVALKNLLLAHNPVAYGEDPEHCEICKATYGADAAISRYEAQNESD
jgi:hypothetical protein